MAGNNVEDALHAAGLHRVLVDVGSDDGAVVVTLVTSDDGPFFASSGVGHLLSVESAEQLQTLLGQQQDIQANVSLSGGFDPDRAMRIVLTRPDDADALADLITENLSAPYAAAYQLCNALTDTGVEAPGLRVRDEGVRIGRIAVRDAVVLGEAVLGASWSDAVDKDDWDWVASELASSVATATGVGIAVDPDPRCSSCGGHQGVVLGVIGVDQARRLTHAVQAVRSASVQASRGDEEHA